MRKLLIALAIVATLVGGYAAIHLSNNHIRDEYLREINAIELPEDWEVLATEAECGKIFGNGNGMQYVVAKLVRSEHPEEDRYQEMWIDSCEEFLEDAGFYYFEEIQESISALNDVQECFILAAEKDLDTFGTFLDCDIRAH